MILRTVIDREELAADKARLDVLSSELGRNRAEHKKYCIEVAKLLIKWRPHFEHGEWYEFLRSCDLHVKTAQRYMRLYGKPKGQTQPSEPESASRAASPKQVQMAQSAPFGDEDDDDDSDRFDPSAAADADDDAAWAESGFGPDDDEEEDGEEDEEQELLGSEVGWVGDADTSLVNGGATPAPTGDPVRPLGERGGSPRGGGAEASSASRRAEQLTLDSLYETARERLHSLIVMLVHHQLNEALTRRLLETADSVLAEAASEQPRTEGRAG